MVTTVNSEISSKDVSDVYIVEVENNFFRIASWKARLIRWLRLERFFGRVYSTDASGLRNICARVNELAHSVSCTKEKIVISLSKLASCLHDVQKKSPLLDAVLQQTCDVASSHYFEFCNDMEKCRSDESRDMSGSFFANIQKENTSVVLCGVENFFREKWEKENVYRKEEQIFYEFLRKEENASPADVAAWFKSELDRIMEASPRHAVDGIHHLISIMRRFLALWKFRVVLQSYGVFVSKNCTDDFVSSFENIAKTCATTFSAEEFLYVMEGLIERKGGGYCKAVASSLKVQQDVRQFFIEYAMKAKDIFGGASVNIIRRVFQNIFDIKSPKIFIATLAQEFVQIALRERSFEWLAPFLGSKISVQKPIAPQAIVRSFSSSDVKRASSQGNIFSFLQQTSPIAAAEQEETPLLPLEQMEMSIVSLLVHNTEFPTFYGEFLGAKIIDKARISQEGSYGEITCVNAKTYRDVLRENTPKQFSDEVIAKMDAYVQRDLLAEADSLLSQQCLWSSAKQFSEMSVQLQRGSIEFCPAAEKIADNFITTFLSICESHKKDSPQRPSLPFLYQTLPMLLEAYSVAISVLGLQAEGKKVFSRLLHAHTEAKNIFEWFARAHVYYGNFPDEQFTCTLPIPLGLCIPQWKEVTDTETDLLNRWTPFFLDPEAIEKSIFRSGASAITIQKKQLKLSGPPSSRIIGACLVAQTLLDLVTEEKKEAHMKAIGALLTVASIDYDPGSIIPNALWGFQRHITPDDTLFFGSPHTETVDSEEKVFFFGYEEGVFYAERHYYYPRFDSEILLDWSFIKTRESISPVDSHLITVNYTSSVVKNKP